ncbi:hypothetical protein SPBR_07739 [Sporothrix brasiliensis 5110]|uniref:Uncharacterized protein n=1 Tax=Sporothrix brasiliensis 5110 TaxID=1398154 RepID=A0A0C2FBG4_9PEZI|nr:uncharacterized protein SPBR_07739 [Sporothrix brasiliensis 5110]KIH88438.1 hypothetical protein SPBR_07739 [Sporothrix brasiliensis 5110]
MGFFDVEGGSTITGVSRKSSRHSSSKHHSSGHHERERDRERGYERKRSRSRSGTRSVNISARSFFGLDDGKKHHGSSSHHHHGGNRSTGSFFSLPNVSSRSIFGSFGRNGLGGSSSSYYRRSPRSNFMQRAYKKLKRLLRDLIYYAKKHPMRVFMLAIMPLITGGALTALLARFGLRMPQSLERMLGVGARAMSGDSAGLVGEAMRMAAVAGTGTAGARAMATSLERGRHGNMQWERRSVERDYFGGGGSLGGRSHSDSGSGWGGSLAGIAKMFS